MTGKIGKYEILELVGTGATADVYHARDIYLGREVALKLLKPALVADPQAFQRFAHEAQTAASPAAAQYALACVVAECLTGRVLFDGETPSAVRTNHVLKGPVGLTTLSPDTPQEYRTVLERALQRKPEERYPTIQAFVEALTQIGRQNNAQAKDGRLNPYYRRCCGSYSQRGSACNPDRNGIPSPAPNFHSRAHPDSPSHAAPHTEWSCGTHQFTRSAHRIEHKQRTDLFMDERPFCRHPGWNAL